MDPAFHPPCRALVDQCADIGRRIHRVADLELRDLFSQAHDEAVVQARVHIDVLHGDAALAGQPHRVEGAQWRRLFDIAVRIDDGLAGPAQLKRDPSQARHRLDLRADPGGAGEGDEVDTRVANQRGADFLAVDDIQYAT